MHAKNEESVEGANNEIREDVEEKLVDLLPYVLSGRYLKKQFFYIVNTVHSYSRDVLAILIGLGFVFPGARLLDPKAKENLGAALSSLPWYEWLPLLGLIIAVAILRVYITRESVERRAHLVEECETDFDLKYIEIEQALQQRNPLQKLTSIRNSVSMIVIRHTRLRSYTFRGGWAPGTNFEAEIRAKELCDRNERKWK